MIKAIITDVDGVLSGSKPGINFPLPHADIIQSLSKIHQKGIPVVLCTAKFNFAIQGIIEQAKLTNPHITDAGALIIDPLDNKVIQKHTIQDQTAKKLIQEFISHKLYLEIYTPSNYFIHQDFNEDIARRRQAILQMEPKIVNLLSQIEELTNQIVKLQVITDQIDVTNNIYKKFLSDIEIVWTQNPSMTDVKICCATKKGVSKETASIEVAKSLGLSFDEILGIGDTAGDWNFMKLCKYVGVIGHESGELKDLAKTKGEGNYYLASSADDNGFLEIVKYFNL
jgi:HAD superfamily hydrolase (TIGR01484 family)